MEPTPPTDWAAKAEDHRRAQEIERRLKAERDANAQMTLAATISRIWLRRILRLRPMRRWRRIATSVRSMARKRA